MPLIGDRLTCDVLSLDGATVIGHASEGAVRLGSARIGSLLDCTNATLRNDKGPALHADNVQVGTFAAGG